MLPLLQCTGAQVDNAQMLPSPFDNVHGGANAVAHIPSSMQQSSAEGDKAAGNIDYVVTLRSISKMVLHQAPSFEGLMSGPISIFELLSHIRHKLATQLDNLAALYHL